MRWTIPTHYAPGTGGDGYSRPTWCGITTYRVTRDPARVSCRRCLASMRRYARDNATPKNVTPAVVLPR